jgi:hypothetical protein
MKMPTRDEIIEQRRKDAYEKKIYSKAEEIVKRLSKGESYRHGYNYKFGYAANGVVTGLAIHLDTGGPNLWINWKGVEVYYYQVNRLERYRPDVTEWIDELNKLYATIEPQIAKEEDDEAKKSRLDFAEKWGEAPG